MKHPSSSGTGAKASGGTVRALRFGALAVLLAGIAAVAIVLLQGRSSYEVTARFVSAGSLVEGNLVRQGAASVGEIAKIGLADDGIAEVTLKIDGDAAPLPQGTVARIRLDGLAGVANRYVSIERPLRGRGEIEDGGILPAENTEAPVDFDALFNALDAPTRKGLQALFRGQAQAYAEKVPEARASLSALAPALTGISDLSEALTRDEPAFRRLLQRGSAAMSALSTDRSQLTELVANTGVATEAIAAEQEALRSGLRRLPTVLDRGAGTLGTLRTTLDALDPLVAASSGVTSSLPALLRQAQQTVDAGGEPLTAVAAAITRPGADNDLVDALDQAPALARISRTALPRAARLFAENLPEMRQLRAYTPDLVSALTKAGQITANYDANGHYARTQADLLAFDLDPQSNELRPSRDAFDQLETKQSQRCPGGATQALLDGSAPQQVPGCMLSATPKGSR